MTLTSLSHLDAFAGRCLAHLVAWQPAATSDGGGAPRGGGGPAASPGGGIMGMLFPMLIVGLIYFVMLRPMNKQRKEQEEMNKALRKGDRVVTKGGIVGTIIGIDDREVVVEIAEKVRVKFVRSAIEQKYDPTAADKPAESADKKA